MIEVLSGRYGTCDGVSRRSFVRVGCLGFAGLNLADLFKIRARAGQTKSTREGSAVIQIFLGGGPSQIDTFDPKPSAPTEFRGAFRAISTNVPGVSVSELFPRLAKNLDKVSIVRSLRHSTADHGSGSHWVMTGYPAPQALLRTNARPSTGSIAAKLRGGLGSGVPPYVALPDNPSFANAAYLGPAYNPFTLTGDPTKTLRVRDLDPAPGITLERLDDRRRLLQELDSIDRSRDDSGMMEGLDEFYAQAYQLITDPKARRAFDLSAEPAKVRERYGMTSVGQSCLLARRLIEAGTTFVTVADGGWDHHDNIPKRCRILAPMLDSALSALVSDLSDRGLSTRVLVVVWGEFGRTPRVNRSAGRDHWPGAMSAILAGGGLKTGIVVGSTGSKGEFPVERPLGPEDVIQTMYHVLGIDPNHEFIDDSGRPARVLNQGAPIPELI
jgi:hypothetical protein